MPKTMTHRERVLSAINHQQPDRVPLDLGSTVDSSIVADAYIDLARHLRVEPKVEFTQRMTQVVNVDEQILRSLDIDTRGIFLGAPYKGQATELSPNEYRDAWGCIRVKPPGGYYYDQVEFPLQGNVSISDIVKYPWPDPDDPGWLRNMRNRLDWIQHNTDCATVLALPAPFVHVSQYVRGFHDWFMDFIRNPDLLDVLFDAVLEVNTQICRNVLKKIGREVDIVFTADDLGTQNGLMVSYAHYKKHIHPRLEQYFGIIHDLTPAKLLFHCCGSVVAIIEDLIQIGVDILNPVQVTAAGMDTAELSRKYGNRLVFWGAIDTQHVLPRGSVKDVKREVETRIQQMSQGGGYVLSAVHNIQPDVSAENIVAMLTHAREYIPSYGP